MTDAILNEVLRLIQQLDRAEKRLIIEQLQADEIEDEVKPKPDLADDEDFVDWPMLDVEVLTDDLKLRREDLYDDPPVEHGDFRKARGVFAWSEDDERAEKTIRRLR